MWNRIIKRVLWSQIFIIGIVLFLVTQTKASTEEIVMLVIVVEMASFAGAVIAVRFVDRPDPGQDDDLPLKGV